ncbi:MAG: (Fe-S)-binding protein [Actinomycetota bacterium]|nr:(Fe-S)-binding protein [Actinomycetota bacterium]
MQKVKNKLDTKKFTIGELLDIEGCTRCGNCTPLCCAYEGSGDIEVSPAKKISVLKKRLDYKHSLLGKMFGSRELSEKELKELEKAAFQCTLCSRCELECPVNIGLKDVWLSLREALVSEGRYPQSIAELKNTLKKGKNISFETNKSRADWIKQIPDIPEDRLLKKTAEVIYFAGCVPSFSPEVFQIPKALLKLFQKADIDFAIMGEDEWCCGFPLLAAGFKEDAMEFAEHNIKSVNERNAKYLITGCPTCFHMWERIYPEIAHGIMNLYTYPKPILSEKMNFTVLHEVQFLSELIKEKRFVLKPLNKKITYHDPCDLGRSSGIYDEPRSIIKAIPEIKFVELKNSRENAKCCGGGGNLEAVSPKLYDSIAELKAQEIIESGADIVVTSCPQCVKTIAEALNKKRSVIKAMDISELLLASIEGSEV